MAAVAPAATPTLTVVMAVDDDVGAADVPAAAAPSMAVEELGEDDDEEDSFEAFERLRGVRSD